MSSVNHIGAQTIDPNALKNLISNPNSTDRQKIAQAGQQFEAIMIRQFLGESLKPMIEGSLGEENAGSDTYRYFLIDTLSQSMAQRGVFGLGQQLAEDLQSKATPKPPPGQPDTPLASPAAATPSLRPLGDVVPVMSPLQLHPPLRPLDVGHLRPSSNGTIPANRSTTNL